MFRSRLSTRWSALLVALFSLLVIVEARKKKEEPVPAEESDSETLLNDMPIHPLVEMIGKYLYSCVDNRKYKFFIYMTIGVLPSEELTLIFLNLLCNLLYGCLMFFGFFFWRRNAMLVLTLFTLYVGPAIILVLIGIVGLALAAFALYPVASVITMWLFFFLTSSLAQAIGKYLGLDHDGDGDVDALDVLHWASSKSWGKAIGLPQLYEVLNPLSRDNFQEIFERLDNLSASLEPKKKD